MTRHDWINIFREDFNPLVKLAFPLALTGLISTAVGFFQTIFFAHLGQEVMSAGALSSWLFGVFIVIICGSLSAINVLVSHKHGANDANSISRVVRDGFLLSVLLAVSSGFLFWNMTPLFLFFGQKSSVVILTKPFFHALVWGLLPMLIVFTLTELLIGLGQVRHVVIITSLVFLLKLFFNFVLIFGIGGMPALGLAGAGWGTTISSWIMLFVLAIYFGVSSHYRIYFKHALNMSKPFYLWKLIKIGLPMGIMYFFEVGFFFALTLISGSLSTQLLVANQIVLQYMGALMTIVFSIAQAVTVRMGHLIGAKNLASAKRVNKLGVGLSITFMSFWALIYCLCPNFLISIDFDVKNPLNSDIVKLATQLLGVCALFQLLEATRISLFGSLRALQDTNFTLISSIISFWGIALPLGYLFVTKTHLGRSGLWWGMTVGAAFSMSLLWWRLKTLFRTLH